MIKEKKEKRKKIINMKKYVKDYNKKIE